MNPRLWSPASDAAGDGNGQNEMSFQPGDEIQVIAPTSDQFLNGLLGRKSGNPGNLAQPLRLGQYRWEMVSAHGGLLRKG